eukprot:6490584-Amphidinium_carterae.5
MRGSLRAEDPKTLTAVNVDQITIRGIKQLTMVYRQLGCSNDTHHLRLESELMDTETTLETIRPKGNNTTSEITSASRLQCSMDCTTTSTTPRILRVGTTTGMTTSSGRRWSMDYIKKIYNQFLCMETTYLEINHNKKRAHHEESKHQLLLHKKSEEEIKVYNLTHLPYRDWCKHRVQGKSRQQYHQKGGLPSHRLTHH